MRRSATILRSLQIAAIAAIVLLGAPKTAYASLVLTSAGIADGFSLSRVTTLPTYCCASYGAFGSAILGNGNLVVNGYSADRINTVNYVFTDIDGQTPAAALSTRPWNDGAYASGLASLSGVVYGTHYSDKTTRVVNADGSEGAIVSNVGRGGIGASLARNSLLVATDAGVEEIDLLNHNPATNYRVVVDAPGLQVDGVTVSPNGQTVFAVIRGRVFGYNISTGAKVSDSGPVSGVDGAGVIVGGVFDGDLVLNTNFGQVFLLNPLTNDLTLIADHGSRGDYVGFDTSNGTLFLSQSNELDRLALKDASIGGGGGGKTPEPSTGALLMAVLLGLLLLASKSGSRGALATRQLGRANSK